MIPQIFDIQNEKLVINQNCLAIPELKAICETYEDPIPALSYLYYRYHPTSSYINMEEDQKDDILLKDFPGEYTLEDEVMINAIAKIKSFYLTPTYKYYLDNKALLERMGTFARTTTTVTTGRDGNAQVLQTMIKSVGKTIQEFKQLEKVVLQEVSEYSIKTRGNKKKAYDQ